MASRRRCRIWALALLAVLSLLAAGCGDDDDASDEDAASEAEPEDEADDEADDALFDRDACELLDDDQIAFMMGDGVESESTPGDASIFQPATCTWTAGDGGIDVANPELTAVTVFYGDHQIFDNTRALAEDGADYEELDDIGDDAYVGSGVGGVLAGQAGITVTPVGVDANAPETHDLIVDLLSQVAENA